MSDENNRLGHDLGWIIGLGLMGVIAGCLYDPGDLGDRGYFTHTDPLAYLVDLDSDYGCSDGKN